VRHHGGVKQRLWSRNGEFVNGVSLVKVCNHLSVGISGRVGSDKVKLGLSFDILQLRPREARPWLKPETTMVANHRGVF
jgi:hypothetical protein